MFCRVRRSRSQQLRSHSFPPLYAQVQIYQKPFFSFPSPVLPHHFISCPSSIPLPLFSYLFLKFLHEFFRLYEMGVIIRLKKLETKKRICVCEIKTEGQKGITWTTKKLGRRIFIQLRIPPPSPSSTDDLLLVPLVDWPIFLEKHKGLSDKVSKGLVIGCLSSSFL